MAIRNKTAAKTVKADKVSAPASNMAATRKDALEVIRGFGETFKKSRDARFNAAVAYAKDVKEGIFDTAEDTVLVVKAYETGTAEPLTDDSRKGVVSNFRAYAHAAVIDRLPEIEKTVRAAMAGKTSAERGGKDLFAACYNVASKLKAAKEKGVTPDPIETIVANIIKPKAKPAKDGGKAKADDVDPIVEATMMFLDGAESLAALKASQLPRGAKKMIEAILALKWAR
jgi:hypothetical protein